MPQGCSQARASHTVPHRSHPIVTACSYPLSMFTLAAGLLGVFTSLLYLDTTGFTCNARPWFVQTSITIGLGIPTLKVWRVASIFSAKQLVRRSLCLGLCSTFSMHHHSGPSRSPTQTCCIVWRSCWLLM